MVAHAIQLTNGGLTTNVSTRFRPSILQLSDQDFVTRFLKELEQQDGLKQLKKKIANTRNKDHVLRLYQPVHRVFHLALIDVSCGQPGEPRLDPKKVVASGLVLRRLTSKGTQLGWMKREGQIVGWRPIPTASKSKNKGELDYDPSPELRRQRALGGNIALLNQLQPANNKNASYEEDFVNLFTTTPEIVNVHGKTFLYGVVPLTSSETSEVDEAEAPFDKKDISQRMPGLLKAGGSSRTGLPPTTTRMYQTYLTSAGAIQFVENLRYLANEVGLFTGTREAKVLYKLLDSIDMPKDSAAKTLARFVDLAYKILVEKDPDKSTSIVMPASWPTIKKSGKGASEQNIVAAIEACMLARWGDLSPAKGRFEDSDARYQLQAFVRVQDTPSCPPRTIWSDPTEAFEIVPWYESSGQPPVQVELPEINKDTLKNLKPNVAFKVPVSVQQFMDKINMDDLMAGKSNKSDTRWGMICGFSIPIITLCAFIFLQIFLSLLNILFFWLPFIKICIPFPKK
jgi:hypothetical protein